MPYPNKKALYDASYATHTHTCPTRLHSTKKNIIGSILRVYFHPAVSQIELPVRVGLGGLGRRVSRQGEGGTVGLRGASGPTGAGGQQKVSFSGSKWVYCFFTLSEGRGGDRDRPGGEARQRPLYFYDLWEIFPGHCGRLPNPRVCRSHGHDKSGSLFLTARCYSNNHCPKNRTRAGENGFSAYFWLFEDMPDLALLR